MVPVHASMYWALTRQHSLQSQEAEPSEAADGVGALQDGLALHDQGQQATRRAEGKEKEGTAQQLGVEVLGLGDQLLGVRSPRDSSSVGSNEGAGVQPQSQGDTGHKQSVLGHKGLWWSVAMAYTAVALFACQLSRPPLSLPCSYNLAHCAGSVQHSQQSRCFGLGPQSWTYPVIRHPDLPAEPAAVTAHGKPAKGLGCTVQ